ncbi:hypothetical protein D3C76_1078970 [compost metagenome]
MTFQLDDFLGDGVGEEACGVPQGAFDQQGVALTGCQQALLDVLVDGRLLAQHEPRTHVHTFCTQHQRRCQGAAVGDPAGGDNRDFHFAQYGGQHHHQRNVFLADVARGLEAIDGDDIGATALGRQRVAHRSAFMDDLDPVFLQAADHWRRVVAGRFHHLHTAFDDRIHPIAVVDALSRERQGQVHTKGFVREPACALDFTLQVGRGWLCAGRHHTEGASIGNRCGQFRTAYPLHATLNDRILDAQQFGDTGFHGGLGLK